MATTTVRYISGSQLNKIRQQRKRGLPRRAAPAASAAPPGPPAAADVSAGAAAAAPPGPPAAADVSAGAAAAARPLPQLLPSRQPSLRSSSSPSSSFANSRDGAARDKEKTTLQNQQRQIREQEIQRRRTMQQQQQQQQRGQMAATTPAVPVALQPQSQPQPPPPPATLVLLPPRDQEPPRVSTAATAAPKHRSFALVIGIEYTAYAEHNPDDRLPGCHADVANMISTLRDRYGVKAEDMIVLADDGVHKEPSRAAIIRAFSKMLTDVARTAAQSPTTAITAWLTYSGHGSRVADRGSSSGRDELDGADETIVPSDYRTAGLIVDDELRTIVDRRYPRRKPGAAAPPVSLYAIFDSCHSGSVMDLPWGWDSADGGAAPKPYSRRRVDPVYSMLAGTVVSLSACTDAQTAVSEYVPEVNPRFPWQGALTRAFCALPPSVSNARDVLGSIQAALASRGLSQKTTICVSRLPSDRALSTVPWPSRQDDDGSGGGDGGAS